MSGDSLSQEEIDALLNMDDDSGGGGGGGGDDLNLDGLLGGGGDEDSGGGASQGLDQDALNALPPIAESDRIVEAMAKL